MIDGLYRHDLLFQSDFKMTKKERLETGEAHLTHCMLLAGVDLIDDKIRKWKVENSWGDEVGEKGFFIMSSTWFDEHVYQVITPKKYLTKKMVKALEQKPVVLPNWHAMT
jgi:bleomycin hydrolase